MVYVDNFRAVLGHKIMCHMIADTTAELVSMARKIGVSKRWIQHEGKYNEHFDICLAKKKLAISKGAKEITSRELVTILKRRPMHPDNIKKLQNRFSCLNTQINANTGISDTLNKM